ncbi:MAG: hypothetical protein ACPGU3_04640 [Litorivicinus sp.]
MSLYPWHQAAFDQISGADFQSLLLVAPPGQGVAGFARALTARVMCAQGTACGTCQSCQWLAQDAHPDVHSMIPEGKAHAHKIEAVRRIIELSGTTTHQGGRRVIQIFEAERMNIAGANGLLKVLEEPPAGTHFILSSTLPGRLPPTILSRCRLYRLPSAPQDMSWLDALCAPSAQRDQAIQLTQAPDELLELLATPELLQARVAWRQALLSSLQGQTVLQSLVDAAAPLPVMVWLDDWYRLCVEQGKAAIDDAERLSRLAKFQARLQKERQPVLEQVTLNPTLMLRALGSLWLRVAA